MLPGARQDLRAACGRCAALCCVAPAFTASAGFAIGKPAGRPCPHLLGDFRCGIHAGLRDRGFPGCAVFDCFGAGQQVTQVTFGGRDWRQDPGTAASMFAAFGVMRQLRELQWYLAEALTLAAALTGAIFCTQPQFGAARGDAATALPASVRRPSAWLLRDGQR